MGYFLKIDISNLQALQMDLLPEMLAIKNFYAFEVTGDLLSAYIKEEDFIVSELDKTVPAGATYSIEKIAEENWNANWENGFSPIRVNNFVAVRASFHPPEKEVDFDLIITPKMSFGTGHHATTYMMLSAMQHIDFFNKSVIDFGAGTGVLAILAEKMGAAEVLAIDNDKWSIENIYENVIINNCTKIEVLYAESIPAGCTANIVLANITMNVLAHSCMAIYNSLVEEGYLLISGIFETDIPAIVNVFNEELFEKIAVCQREKWVSVLFKKA